MSKLFLSASILLILHSVVNAQGTAKNSLQGKILDGSTMKPAVSAVVIVQEAGIVATVRQDGTYLIQVQRAGVFTVKIQAAGFQTITTSINIEGTVIRDFPLNPTSGRKNSITVRGERDIQRISRQTMTAKQLKEVPASFGDSISALATLPGVNRPMGFFGPLVIRGADSTLNGYFIDDIPMFNPMHFGGIHSVINNDLLSEIDLYSSAFPSQFGNTQAAIINLNTIDDVTRTGGNAEVGLISANALIKAPITESDIIDGKQIEKNKGYVIASGRVGYLSVFIPLIYKVVMNKTLDSVPEYWDYQFKTKYKFDEHQSMTFFAFGSKDYFKHIHKKEQDPGEDPLMMGSKFEEDTQSHAQGLYYNYKMDGFSNTMMAYDSINITNLVFQIPQSSQAWLHDFTLKSIPIIFGFKDKLVIEWWKSHAELRTGVEANFYKYRSVGKKLIFVQDTGNFETSFNAVNVDETISNSLIVLYAENKFSVGGLTFVPGIHSEYLTRTSNATVDPRGAISYTFPTRTTIAAAGGSYSKFVQSNLNFFDMVKSSELVSSRDLAPQRSIHSSVSIEQKIDDFTFKVEGFYNNFWDIVVSDTRYVGMTTNTESFFTNASKLKTYGIEVSLKINDENEEGLFGWVSYTYNKTRYKTNQTAPFYPYGGEWNNSPFEMRHVGKLVAGYTKGRHTISARYQYNSSLPYTPYTGATKDNAYTAGTRYVPIEGKPNSAHMSPDQRLDIRYSYKTNYSWGHITWFIEIINATNYNSDEYYFDHRYDYSEGTNPIVRKTKELALFPNFGVEAKF
jgi:hypothetical protein